jgi:hypothetical protein
LSCIVFICFFNASKIFWYFTFGLINHMPTTLLVPYQTSAFKSCAHTNLLCSTYFSIMSYIYIWSVICLQILLVTYATSGLQGMYPLSLVFIHYLLTLILFAQHILVLLVIHAYIFIYIWSTTRSVFSVWVAYRRRLHCRNAWSGSNEENKRCNSISSPKWQVPLESLIDSK